MDSLPISRIRLHWVQVPLWEPFRISNGEISTKDAILVAIETDGLTGWGEASPLAASAYSAETPESSWDRLHDHLIPALLAGPNIDPWQIIQRLAEDSIEPFARAGLEGALWDLLAQHRSVPLWSMLGGRKRPVPSGAAIGLMDTTADLLARVDRFLGEGYQRIKIKIAPGHDLELVRAVREKFGSISLMVDANAAYSIDDASIFEQMDAFGLMMIEQPLGRLCLEEHAELQRRLRTPICLDESGESPDAVRAIIRLGSGRVLNIKVQRMGGLLPALQAHNLASAAGLPCWLGTMPELGIASTQGLHLATLPGFTYPTDVESSERWFVQDLIEPPIVINHEGFICLTDRPGAGYQVLPSRIAQYCIRSQEFRP